MARPPIIRPDRPLKKQLSLIREFPDEAEEADLFPSYEVPVKEVREREETTKSRGGSIRFSEHTPLIQPPQRRRKNAINVYRRAKMSVCNTICYGLGGAPYQLTNTVIGFYISVFLLDTAEIPPIYAALIIFLGRLWDAMSDPLVGRLVTKTNTRFGKLKPWMFFGTPLAVTSYFCIWYIPETNNLFNKVVWYLLFYCAFQTFLTFYQMPFGTLSLFVTDKAEERETAVMIRMFVELLANVLGNVIMGQSLSLYVDARVETGCAPINETKPTVPPLVLEVRGQAYMIGAGTICGLFLLCAAAVIFGTKEHNFPKPFIIPREEPFLKAIKRVVTFKPWLLHVGTFLSFITSLQIVQGNFALFNKYTVGIYNYQNAIILVLLSAFAFVPIWNKFKARFGKKTTLAVGMLPTFPLIVIWGTIPYGQIWTQYLCCVIMGSSLAVVQLAPWAMVPDVIDAFLLKTNCSYETIFFTFYVMFVKFAAGMCLSFSTFMLGVVAGYETRACEQPDSVILMLRLLVTVVPSAGLILGYIFLWHYPINEEVRQKNQTIMEIWRDDGRDERRKTTLFRSKEQRSRSRSMRTSTMSFM